jgi:hypothetical protein
LRPPLDLNLGLITLLSTFISSKLKVKSSVGRLFPDLPAGRATPVVVVAGCIVCVPEGVVLSMYKGAVDLSRCFEMVIPCTFTFPACASVRPIDKTAIVKSQSVFMAFSSVRYEIQNFSAVLASSSPLF